MGTSLIRNRASLVPTVELCLGPYGDPREGGLLRARYPGRESGEAEDSRTRRVFFERFLMTGAGVSPANSRLVFLRTRPVREAARAARAVRLRIKRRGERFWCVFKKIRAGRRTCQITCFVRTRYPCTSISYERGTPVPR